MLLRVEDVAFIGMCINDYANYHVSLLNNKRYQAFNGDFIDSVVRGGYATDPNYKNALTNVYNQIAKGQKGLIVQAVNKVKSFLPKEEPKEPINTVGVIKEYGPSVATSFLTGNINPLVSKLFEGNKPTLDYTHKFGSTDDKFKEFADTMTPIFREALEENGLPTTNLNNLVRQAALESNYGLDPRGERGFNLSGIKHPGDSIAPKYKKSRYKDGFDYIDFDDLKSYANYKVKVLNDRYKALDAKDTNDFIDRLHGNNSGKYNYSADKDSYRRNLNGTLSLNKYLKRGGIIKYQNPSSGIKYMGGYDKRGNMVLPVTNENGMNNVTLPEVTVTPRNINLAGAVDRGRRVAGNIGKEILSATTPLGDIESAKDIYQDTTSGNYGQAALGAGLLLLPNFIEKPLKTLKRVGKDYITITKDVVSSPKKFIQARKSGTYPLTYAERRAYLEKAHNIGDLASNRVKNLNREDFNFRKKRDPNGFHEFIPVEGVNTKYTFNSKSWENFDSSYNSLGTNSRFDNINSHIRIKESPDSKYLIPTNGVNGIGAIVAHELQHSYQRVLPDIKNMGGNKVSNGLVDVNPYHEASPILTPLKENSGKWVGDPLELNSEIMSLRAGLNASRYNLMTPKQQKIVNDIISQKFQLNPDITHNMLNELGKLGYRNGGKL